MKREKLEKSGGFSRMGEVKFFGKTTEYRSKLPITKCLERNISYEMAYRAYELNVLLHVAMGSVGGTSGSSSGSFALFRSNVGSFFPPVASETTGDSRKKN